MGKTATSEKRDTRLKVDGFRYSGFRLDSGSGFRIENSNGIEVGTRWEVPCPKISQGSRTYPISLLRAPKKTLFSGSPVQASHSSCESRLRQRLDLL